MSKPKDPTKPKAPHPRHRGERVSSPRRVKAQVRVADAIQLRISGASFAAIADACGYLDAKAAWEAVMDNLRRMVREPAIELVSLELTRLDGLFLAAYPLARAGSLTAIDRCIKIMERRARLLGLDLPQQVEVFGKGGGPVQVTEVFVRGAPPPDDKPA
jgi:hypothetical protein